MRVTAGRLVFWTLTMGGLGLALYAAVFDAPPFWLVVVFMLVYVGFSTLGVLIPQLEVYGDVFWRGGRTERGVVLTFDDGPDPHTTPKILDILDARGVVATFFVVGRKVAAYPDLAREIIERGHSLGLHGYEHERLYCFKTPRAVVEDIEKTQAAVFEACGQRLQWFRPPVGFVSHRTAVGAKRAGVRLVAWSVRGYDGRPGRAARSVLRALEAGLRDGALLLLHDAAERDDFRPVSIDILNELLDRIEHRQLRVRSLGDFVKPGS